MPTFRYPRTVLELEVPRKQAVFPGYRSAYYGREMRIDQVDPKDIPPEGGMTLPASTGIWQEPLTGFIGLKPDFLYDSQAAKDSAWEGAEAAGAWQFNKDAGSVTAMAASDERSQLAETALARASLLAATRNGYTSTFEAQEIFNFTNRIAKPSGLLDTLILVAIETILFSSLTNSLWPLLQSTAPMRQNQGFRIFCAAGNGYLSKCPHYLVVRFGRFMLSIGTDGGAKLYGLPHAESWDTKPNFKGQGVETLAEWQFAAKPGNENIHLVVLPVRGNLCIYLQTPDVTIGSAMNYMQTHRNPGLPLAKVGHLVQVPPKYLRTQGDETITTEPGKLHIFGHRSYSYNLEVFKVQYPLTGTYYSPAEQLERPTLAGGTGEAEPFDYAPAGCSLTASLVDGDIADGEGLPTAWNMATSGQHPRSKVVLTRPANDANVTPYLQGYCLKFGPVFMPDNRTQLTFYQPYRVSLTKNRQQSTWSAHCDLVFGLDGRDVPVTEDWNTLAAAYTLFTERPDSPYRLWCEVDNNRANDVLLMAGYVDAEVPVTMGYITDRLAKFSFTLKPMFGRLNECHFTRTDVWDNRTFDYALRDALECAGFDCSTQYVVAAGDAGIENETFPNAEGELANRYRPKPNAELGKIVETALTLFDKENEQVELVWVALAGVLGADNRPQETWLLRKRRNPPSETSPPAIAWNICLNERDMGNHSNSLMAMERPALRIYPAAANTVWVITDANGDSGCLEVGPTAFSTGSMDQAGESLVDPSKANYLGRAKRTFLIAPDMRGPEFKDQAEALAAEALKLVEYPYYEMDVTVPWVPGLGVDDYVQVWYRSGAEYKKFWIKEISVDFDDSQTTMARLTLTTIWQRESSEC